MSDTRSFDVARRALAAVPAPSARAAVLASAHDATLPRRRLYLVALTWAFTIFNSVRVLAYLPTLWAICVAGDSSQHSVATWITWLGANATMALWLYEQNGRRADKAVIVNVGNTTMCFATIVAILWQRF